MTATLTRARPGTDRALSAYLQLLCAGHTDWRLLEIRYLTAYGRMNRRFVDAQQIDAAARSITSLAAHSDVYCGVLLRIRHAGGRDAVAPGRLAWAEIDQLDALTRLDRFVHSPTMIVRSGTRGHAHAYWRLRHDTGVDELEAANRRLASALGADPAATDAARILRPCGTLNHKHTPPTPVTLAVHRPHRAYPLAELVGDLADPPTPPGCAAAGRDRRTRVGELDAALLAIPTARYVRALTGRELGRDGKLACPFHDDSTPSLQTYDDGTFYCFGCQTGGSIYDFAAALWSMPTKGRAFVALRHRLLDELLT